MSGDNKSSVKATPNQPPVDAGDEEDKQPEAFTFESQVLVDK